MPRCRKRCGKVMECGHECTRLCHPGECTNCQVEVETNCACTNGMVKVKCMDKHTKNRCDKVCNILMECGHKCTAICHDHYLMPKKCTSKCLKYRVDSCGHLCGRTCHFDSNEKCDALKCLVSTGVFCKCNNIYKYVPCN